MVKLSKLLFTPFITLFITGILSFTASAKTLNLYEQEAANPLQVHTIDSKFYSKEREFMVHLPFDYQQNSDKRYPVIYMLDGQRQAKLKALINDTNFLALKNKMPQVIIVALPVDGLRKEDYTPNAFKMRRQSEYGNGDNFTQWLKTIVIPHIDKQYRTQPMRIISGTSLGGLFVVNDFVSNSGLFTVHLAFSPALYYDDYGIIEQMAKKESKDFPGNKFLFSSAGGDENLNILTSVAKLDGQLKRLTKTTKSGITWHTQVTAHDSHGTSGYAGHYQALRKLFKNWDKPAKQFKTVTLPTLLNRYQKLSDEYGFEVVPNTYGFMSAGYNHLKAKRFDLAMKAFKLNIKHYPDSGNAYDCLADALEAQGFLVEAKKMVDKGLGLLTPQSEYYKGVLAHQQKLQALLSVNGQ